MSNNKQQSLKSVFSSANSNNNNSSSSRFGSSSPNASSSSSGRSLLRFGRREDVKWTITSPHKIAVRVGLEGLGDPLHRLLGTPASPELSQPSVLVQALNVDSDLRTRLTTLLDQIWSDYKFQGASIVYPCSNDVSKAFSGDVYPLVPLPEKSDDAPEGDESASSRNEDKKNLPDWLSGEINEPVANRAKTYRAFDVAFVINLLARTRANTIVSNTPLALEQAFLEQTLIIDDPRLVRIAQSTGCIEESW